MNYKQNLQKHIDFGHEATRTIRISFDDTVTKLDIDALFNYIKQSIRMLKMIGE